VKRPLTAAFVLGALTVGGFAPFQLFPLPLLTLALLFRLWRAAESPRRAALLGFAFGLGFFLGGVSWIYVSLSVFGGMAPPLAGFATVLFCAAMALYPMGAGYAFARWKTQSAAADAALVAGLWLLAEWLRGWVLTGFPWLALGYSQSPPSPLAGYAPVLGSYGIGFLVAWLAASAAFATNRMRTVAVFVAVFGIGLLLRGVAWTEPVDQPVRVALLQGNVPQSLKWDPKRLSLSIDTYVGLAQKQKADLIVLPETAIPLMFDQIPRDVLDALTRTAPALLGVAVRIRDGGYTNGAVAITRTADGGFEARAYAKSHLVPFGEYAPPGFAWFFQLARIPMSDFTAGPSAQPPLPLAGLKVAPNICYEDVFGEEIIRALPDANLLINLSNTAWFGDSLAQPQHLQAAQLRALETGRPMLRATNTGMTAAIAPDGGIAGLLEPFTVGALNVTVTGYSGLTPYARYGNLPALALAILALLPTLRNRRRLRNRG
jgi:apolipoprotein N-acyltransferase